MVKNNGKGGGNIFRRPPKICLMCGPADKMAVVPNACKLCHFWGAADPKVAATIASEMAAIKVASSITWMAVGRCLDDFAKRCPAELFDPVLVNKEKPIPLWICKGLPCSIPLGDRGEDIHPHWRCWVAWLSWQMGDGEYSPGKLEARRKKMVEDMKAAEKESKDD